ncbi:PREDICTED: syntaxin-6-like [Amphimedon queenslandica]|uniref:t-SNARE coiled-coil homology domain-containing protein n=1 Tax=Amphimedon queenslandica TaxID=400682 RepID=A0A1X7U4K5_AMPQE|nr:PREDICTED: syntaxin-6-like [Amphimedon queenslandica]|eukprot:XP_003389021.1 PREDICTED: syntaxin-6-like [Amphimedon queenslandica]
MSLEDPFYTVRDDVRESLNNAQDLYSRWCMLLEDQSDLEKTQGVSTDLRSCIKSIEWDLQDLDETISVVEANPQKFRVSTGEIETRKQFIRDTRQVINKMKSHMSSDQAQNMLENMKRQQLLSSSHAQKKKHGRYQRLDDELERSNQDFIDQQRHQQQMLMVEQDKQVDKVSNTIVVLHQMGEDIGIELDEQNKMIDEIDEDMQRTETRLTSLTKRVNTAIRKSSDRCQLICIVVLIIVIVLIVVMFFVPF